MQLIDGRPVFSATDLVGYLACEHLLGLERALLRGAIADPARQDELLDLLRERGEEHEGRYLRHLEGDLGLEWAEGRHPRDETLDRGERIKRDAKLTSELMTQGVPIIYQATLFDGTFLGYADFLQRVDGPTAASSLGPWHYEVADTKLARRTKAGALIQLCVYADLVSTVQGRVPAQVHVALGGGTNRVESHRTADYLAYFRMIRSRFFASLPTIEEDGPPLPKTPEVVSHCSVCRWAAVCSDRRRRDDHLSRVAFLRRDHAERLRAVEIRTRGALASLHEPLPAVQRVSESTLRAARDQAAVQVASDGRDVPVHEVIQPIEADRGLAALPVRSWGDLFFDMEGDPFAEVDGLEYLFGVIDPSQRDATGEPRFHAWWAHSALEEKAAFEAFIDFVMARWEADPTMHVYHYAAYERGRLGMLSTRHATREDEVDRLLRGNVLVDLYRVVRQGLRVGTESYSIKKLEPLYALHRKAPLKEAGLSVVAYERYVRSRERGDPDDSILDDIARYNADDCLSNLALRDFLEEQRTHLATDLGIPVPRPEPHPEEREREPSDRDRRVRAVAERLLADPLPDPDVTWSDDHARHLLAHLLEWHRREEKSEWWEFFRLCGLTDAELVREETAIGELTYQGVVDTVKRSAVHRYRYDPGQEHRFRVGDNPVDPRTQGSAGRIVAIDPLAGSVDLMRAQTSEAPHPTALIPQKPITADPQKAALERIGQWVADNGIAADGPYRAARDLLRRMPPHVADGGPGPILPPSEPLLPGARRLATSLRHATLPVQGPPGSGKTYVGAEMILALVEAGRQVGISAFTHKAIANLLDEVVEHAAAQGRPIRAIRKMDEDEIEDGTAYRCTTKNEHVSAALVEGTVNIAAGTAWMWSRPEFEGLVDTLVIDEAGQLSLANVVAVSGAARNLILLGDPQQLPQVSKGAHPDGAGASGLEHALMGASTIADDRGIFLPETWRMHSALAAWTSEVFYEDRLRSRPEADAQRVHGNDAISGTGVRWIAVEHAGNRNASPEEADVVRNLVLDLLGRTWTGRDGIERPITREDILVVAPYNAQVQLLREILPEARVGTVDRFQGQEGAVVIYSLATSSEEELPRSMEFLYSLNRLNVATSRAKCLAFVVASPRLLDVACHTPAQMRLVNALCRYVEMATEVRPEQALQSPSLAERAASSAAPSRSSNVVSGG